MPETSDAEQEHSTRRHWEAVWTEQTEQWGKGARVRMQATGWRRNSIYRKARSERWLRQKQQWKSWLFFQGLITAKRCTWHGSVLTPVHLLPLMQSQIQERELTGEDGRLLCIHVFLEAIHFLLVKCTQKLLEPEKETTDGLTHELQKHFILIRRTLRLMVWIFVLQMQFVYIYLIIFITNLFSVALIWNH